MDRGSWICKQRPELTLPQFTVRLNKVTRPSFVRGFILRMPEERLNKIRA